MLGAVMFCYLFYYTGRQSFGFAIPGMVEELGLSKTQLGWCGAAMLWAYAVGQAINGPLADRFGGRRMMTLGGVISFGLNVILSFSRGLTGIAVPWTTNGFAQSMGWPSGSRILSNWWDHRHLGRVYGWYGFAAGCSSVLSFALAALVLDFGWRWIFRLPVILMLVGVIVFWLVARDRPSELGFADLPDDGAGERKKPVAEASGLSTRQRYRACLGCPPFLFSSAAIGFQNLARYGLLIWVPVHFLGADWEGSSQKWVVLALPLGMAPGAVCAGWMSDRLFSGRRALPIILFLGLAAACALGMGFLPRESGLALPLLFLTGFFVYGPQAGFWALCPDLLGRRMAGTGTGIMNFFAYLFAGLGGPLIGLLIERSGSTSTVFPVVAVACLLGAALMGFVRH